MKRIFLWLAFALTFLTLKPATVGADFEAAQLQTISCNSDAVSFNFTVNFSDPAIAGNWNRFFWYSDFQGDPSAGIEEEYTLPQGSSFNGFKTFNLDTSNYSDGDTVNVAIQGLTWEHAPGITGACTFNGTGTDCGQGPLATSCQFIDLGVTQCVPNAGGCDPAVQTCSCISNAECCSNYCDVAFGHCTDDPTGVNSDATCVIPPDDIVGINTAIGCIPISDPNNPIDSRNLLAAFFLRWGIGIGGGIAFLLIVYSGIMILTSAGNPDRLRAGQELLTAAITGLLLLIFSAFILRVIGIDILQIQGL